MLIGILVFFLIISGTLTAVAFISLDNENQVIKCLFVSLPIFLTMFVWILISSSYDWVLKETKEYNITLIDDTAVVKDGNEFINMNKKLGKSFKNGDKVYKKIYDPGPYFGVKYDNNEVWIEDK